MGSIQFNPFEDRLSRDIRNDLSETIIGTIENRSLAEAEKIAASITGNTLAAEPQPFFRPTAAEQA